MNTDRHSFKSDQTDALSLSVYNVGYEKCQGLHSWGSGVRDHYLIHHIISGKGVYKTPQGEYHLSAGDTFLIYPYTVKHTLPTRTTHGNTTGQASTALTLNLSLIVQASQESVPLSPQTLEASLKTVLNAFIVLVETEAQTL